MMTRKQALAIIRCAGAANDQVRFIRLYTENRIPISVASQAFNEGRRFAERFDEWMEKRKAALMQVRP